MNHGSDYNTSKFGVRGLWHSVRKCTGMLGYGEVEGAPMFRTNLLAPYFVRTEMIAPVQGIFDKIGLQCAEIEDVVDGAFRCLTDEEVIGEYILIMASRTCLVRNMKRQGLTGMIASSCDLHCTRWERWK
jgi:5'-hydroxyaverantin dehydrogenase